MSPAKRPGHLTEPPRHPQRPPYRIRLPAFLLEEEVGLGELLERVTYALGIKPCGGCEKRAAALNRWIQFSQ